MGETSIEWTERTWNPVRGCSRVSEGCRNCYAERIAARFSDVGKPFHGFANIGPRRGEPSWTGHVALIPEKLDEPLRWRKPSMVFVNSMSDLFHEKLSDWDISRVFLTMDEARRHTFQILTKRPARMLAFFEECNRRGSWTPLPNVWLGVSVEDQATADGRIPLLLQTPAAVRFVSYEPALGPVDFDRWIFNRRVAIRAAMNGPMALNEDQADDRIALCLDWLIYGGESGPGARPNDVAWARSARDQCRAAGVSFFYKQGGAASRCEHDAKGGHLDCAPADLRIREFPT